MNLLQSGQETNSHTPSGVCQIFEWSPKFNICMNNFSEDDFKIDLSKKEV